MKYEFRDYFFAVRFASFGDKRNSCALFLVAESGTVACGLRR